MTNDAIKRVRKFAFINLFIASIIIFLITFRTLTGSASTIKNGANRSETSPSLQATPTADYFEAATPEAPIDTQNDNAGNFVTLFLPIIYKAIFQEPLVTVSGVVIDPPVPNAQSLIEPLSTVIIDPGEPTPPTPAPGEPTWTPTPGPGTPSATPTPKPSLTPTSMPTATAELVPGGGFETSSDRSGWTQRSLLNYELLFDEDEGLPQAPGGAFEGDWYAWLGGDNNEISYIQREFVVPDNPDYLRYYFAYRANFQSYDSVCATTKYSTMPINERDEMLAGHLRFATSGTLNIFGVDLGGTIICVNEPGQSGCSADNVKDLPGGRQAIYVVYYDLCNSGSGSGWDLFLFPISPVVGGPNLAGEEITVQIKTITDSQLSSSVLIDNVSYAAGPPLPTPSTASLGGVAAQTQNEVHVGVPILAPDIIPQLTPGAQIIQSETKLTQPIVPGAMWRK